MSGGSSQLLVSVVMPFKDAVDFLEQAAGSVLAQTWSAVELVLVDDGGDDGSLDVAERLRAAHPDRVHLVSHPGGVNLGIGASRRLGFQHASGAFVACLDADDVWEPGHLADVVGLLLSRPGAGVVQGRVWNWCSWADPRRADLLSALPFAPGVVVPGQEVLGAVLRFGGYAVAPCGVLARAELLEGWTEALDAFPGMYEDQVLHSGLQLRSPVVMSGSATAWYRQHDTSFSAQQLIPHERSRFDRGRREFLLWLAEQPELDDPEVRALLERNRDELRRRTGSADPSPGAPALTAPAPLLPPEVRRVAARARGRVEQGYGRRGGGSETARAAASALPERLRRLLHRNGSDLRGRVLVLGDRTGLPGELPRATLDARTLPARPWAGGPLHPCAYLPSSAYDCLVVVERDREAVWDAAAVRHLRRVLAPGGVLLLVQATPSAVTESAVREEFGAHLVRADWQAEPGPARRPVLCLRAAVPA